MMPLFDKIVPALMQAANAAVGRTGTITSFSLTTTSQDGGWAVSITTGIPETDAARTYSGSGQGVRSALAELAMNVIMDKPEQGAMG